MNLPKILLDNIIGTFIVGILGIMISYFFIGYLIIPVSVILLLIVFGIVIYFLIINKINCSSVSTYINKIPLIEIKSSFIEKYKKLLLRFVVFILLIIFIFLIKNFIVRSEVDYQSDGITYIQNLKVDKKSAITKNEYGFKMRKDPVQNHPYIGIKSLGSLGFNNRAIIEMTGILKGKSEIGIVLTENSTFPTEYIELLAATYKHGIGLNDVDGKGKHGIDKIELDLYEDKKFSLIMIFDKQKGEVCSYYNSKFNPLFNKTCSLLPNNLNLSFIGFKMVDDDVSNNNLFVPEITSFKVYSLRF